MPAYDPQDDADFAADFEPEPEPDYEDDWRELRFLARLADDDTGPFCPDAPF